MKKKYGWAVALVAAVVVIIGAIWGGGSGASDDEAAGTSSAAGSASSAAAGAVQPVGDSGTAAEADAAADENGAGSAAGSAAGAAEGDKEEGGREDPERNDGGRADANPADTNPADSRGTDADVDAAGESGAGETGAGQAGDGDMPGEAATYQRALDSLRELEVKGRSPKTGYTREQFGSEVSAADFDGNGCKERDDILRRDLIAAELRDDGCTVARGTLLDPYTGKRIDFIRTGEPGGYSNAVQIDHIVAISDAWQKGAQQWDQAKREALAHDPLNLVAVDGPANSSKGDGDAATWLPPNRAYRCTYVSQQVAVKQKYGLWVTAAEKSAIEKILVGCGAK